MTVPHNDSSAAPSSHGVTNRDGTPGDGSQVVEVETRGLPDRLPGVSLKALFRFDFIDSLKASESWIVVAWGELTNRYGRTVFGASWNILTFAAFCLVIILLFGSLQPDLPYDFGTYVVVGFLLYTFQADMITDASTVYIENEYWMTGSQIPYGFYIYKGLTRNFIVFGYNLAAAIIILVLFYDFQPHVSQLYILAAIPIILFNGVLVYTILGTFCVRYRDFVHLIGTVMRFSIFMTPIMWTADSGGVRGLFAIFNPMTHFIEIVRQPILTGDTPVMSWMIVGGITVTLTIVASAVYALTRRRLVYWL